MPKKIERPRITVIPLPCRWYSPGRFGGNPNWELRTLCDDDFLGEVCHDGADYYPYIPGLDLDTRFATVAECKQFIETTLADASQFK